MIDTGISANHAKTWNVGQAVRELVQNWLDVKSQFSCTGHIVYDNVNQMASFKDGGPGMQMKHLAFGESDKAEGSIGQFGEGLKSAMIVLARNGRKLELRTNGMLILPTIAMSKTFGTETLHFKVMPMAARLISRWTGTSIRVAITKDELDEGKSYFSAFKHRDNSGFDWIERDAISLPGGIVYANGSAIGHISNAEFSYHLVGSVAQSAVNRDRNSVDMTIVEPAIANMISHSHSTKLIAQIMKAMIGKTDSYESKLSLRPTWSATKLWKRTWTKHMGKHAVLSSNSQDNSQAEYRGYDVISLDHSATNFLNLIGIKSSEDLFAPKYRSARPNIGKVGIRSLDETQSENLKWARRMVNKHYAETGKIIVCDRLNNLTVSVNNPNGAYSPANDTIYMNRAILSNKSQTLHTLLHEAVHKVSGASDLTSEFERALLQVAVKMIENKQTTLKGMSK
jgi:hypothetical protein